MKAGRCYRSYSTIISLPRIDSDGSAIARVENIQGGRRDHGDRRAGTDLW
jgi:hypothetical protein